MENRLYNTRQKVQILELLKQNKDKHMTVDDMMLVFITKKIPVSRATLYRYLDVLVSTGEVRKFYIGENEKACYQYIDESTSCQNHFHLLCIECGKLEHLNCDKINNLITHVEKDHKFKVDPGRVVFYGICEECQKKEEIK